MAAVISEVVTDAARLYHDSHSMMGGHAQSGSSATAEHSYNRLNTPQSLRNVPPSPRPQPTSIPQGTPPRSAVQRATGETGTTPDSSLQPAPAARPSVQRAATHGGDTSRHNVGNQQKSDSHTAHEESRRPGQKNDLAFAENSRTSTTISSASTTAVSTQAAPPLVRAGLSLQDVRNHGGRRKNVIEVKSLDHIQSFASEDFLAQGRRASKRTGTAREESGGVLKYDISDMPVADIIEMVAGLLTKITTTNDRQHETLHRNIHSNSTNTSPPVDRDGQGMSPMTSSVLAFHGKNVPPITILSYLSRIHKYCPTTYDVFLSLLVYFDRMTERVNAEPLAELKRRSEQHHHNRRRRDNDMEIESEDEEDQENTNVEYEGDSEDEEDDDEDIADSEPNSPPDRGRSERDLGLDGEGRRGSATDLNHFFVVDGFNIHRLVIAGVTCASKFFSDVFYTNSRYAKVGGLPLNELNHLELQFLLLNDFRLSVPVEELEAYGTMLVEFYAREVVEQRKMEGGEGEGGDVVMMET